MILSAWVATFAVARGFFGAAFLAGAAFFFTGAFAGLAFLVVFFSAISELLFLSLYEAMNKKAQSFRSGHERV
jgi:hypothetical protein